MPILIDSIQEPKLALLKLEGWRHVVWWKRSHPTLPPQKYSPGPFLGPAADVYCGKWGGYTVDIVGRPDRLPRPSIQSPSIQAVAARWPRLTSTIMTTCSLTSDEAAHVLNWYIQGRLWITFGRWSADIINHSIRERHHFRESAKTIRHLVHEFAEKEKTRNSYI